MGELRTAPLATPNAEHSTPRSESIPQQLFCVPRPLAQLRKLTLLSEQSNRLWEEFGPGGESMATRHADSVLKGKKSRSQGAMVSRDINRVYVKEYIYLYFKILKIKGSATPCASFIKAQVCDRKLSAIKIRFNKALVGWGSTGVQSGVHFYRIRPLKVTIPVARLVWRSLP
jgi:hypothetical protein